MKNTTPDLLKTQEEKTAIVMPAVTPDEAVAAWKAYQDLKTRIATPEDIQNIQGKVFYKKSYWRKIATFFNLSVEITEQREESKGTNVIYHFTQKAIAPNGRFAYGTGSCDQMEKGRVNTIHNTRSTAETRAFNRAISNLVGGGEVSAEEMTEDMVKPLNASQIESSRPTMAVYEEDGTPISQVNDDKRWCSTHPNSFWGKDTFGNWYEHCVAGKYKNEVCEIGVNK